MDRDREQKIRDRAHAIWEREGRPHGRHNDHWRLASDEIEHDESGPAMPASVPEPVSSASLASGSAGVSSGLGAASGSGAEGAAPEGASR